MNNSSIEITEFKKVNGGNLKAYASVRIGTWVIHDWRITQKGNQRALVSPPLTSWRGPDGKVNYRSLLSIPGEQLQQIELTILLAWQKENQREEQKR